MSKIALLMKIFIKFVTFFCFKCLVVYYICLLTKMSLGKIEKVISDIESFSNDICLHFAEFVGL